MFQDIDLADTQEEEFPTNLVQIKKKIEKVQVEKDKDKTKINPKEIFGKLFNFNKKKKKKYTNLNKRSTITYSKGTSSLTERAGY